MLDVQSKTLAAAMSNGSDHLSLADLTVQKKSTVGGGNGNDLLSMGDGISLGNLTPAVRGNNHSVPALDGRVSDCRMLPPAHKCIIMECILELGAPPCNGKASAKVKT